MIDFEVENELETSPVDYDQWKVALCQEATRTLKIRHCFMIAKSVTGD